VGIIDGGRTGGRSSQCEHFAPAWSEFGTSACRFNSGVAIPEYEGIATEHAGRPYRTLFAFERVAILLIGGDKTGNNRWYDEFVPKADKIYAEHLKEISKEENE
jgi:Phage derived protein Gp49-like (DUF891)